MTGSFKCASERGRGKGKIRANRLHREATGGMSRAHMELFTSRRNKGQRQSFGTLSNSRPDS